MLRFASRYVDLFHKNCYGTSGRLFMKFGCSCARLDILFAVVSVLHSSSELKLYSVENLHCHIQANRYIIFPPQHIVILL